MLGIEAEMLVYNHNLQLLVNEHKHLTIYSSWIKTEEAVEIFVCLNTKSREVMEVIIVLQLFHPAVLPEKYTDSALCRRVTHGELLSGSLRISSCAES